MPTAIVEFLLVPKLLQGQPYIRVLAPPTIFLPSSSATTIIFSSIETNKFHRKRQGRGGFRQINRHTGIACELLILLVALSDILFVSLHAYLSAS